MENEKKSQGRVDLRWLTPVLVTVAIFFLGNVSSKLCDIDGKLFHHLTNAEIHTARNLIVGREEFLQYQRMRETQLTDIEKQLDKIESYLVRVVESIYGRQK